MTSTTIQTARAELADAQREQEWAIRVNDRNRIARSMTRIRLAKQALMAWRAAPCPPLPEAA
jgi:hypothetical protein